MTSIAQFEKSFPNKTETMNIYKAIKHGYRKVLVGHNPTSLHYRYDVVVWLNDGSENPVTVGTRINQKDALEFGKRWVDGGGQVARHGVLGHQATPLLLK